MDAEQNRKVVQAAYEAFLRGEMEAVFDVLADDVVWTNHSGEGNPIRGVFYGKSGVQQFFSHFDQFDLERFDVRDYVAIEDTVIVVIDSKTTVKATGKSSEGPHIHVMKLRDGKLASWDEYEDVAHNPWV